MSVRCDSTLPSWVGSQVARTGWNVQLEPQVQAEAEPPQLQSEYILKMGSVGWCWFFWWECVSWTGRLWSLLIALVLADGEQMVSGSGNQGLYLYTTTVIRLWQLPCSGPVALCAFCAVFASFVRLPSLLGRLHPLTAHADRHSACHKSHHHPLVSGTMQPQGKVGSSPARNTASPAHPEGGLCQSWRRILSS